MSMSDPLNHLRSIWYHSKPLEVPYSPNQFLGWDFFCHFLQQTSSSCILFWRLPNKQTNKNLKNTWWIYAYSKASLVHCDFKQECIPDQDHKKTINKWMRVVGGVHKYLLYLVVTMSTTLWKKSIKFKYGI